MSGREEQDSNAAKTKDKKMTEEKVLENSQKPGVPVTTENSQTSRDPGIAADNLQTSGGLEITENSQTPGVQVTTENSQTPGVQVTTENVKKSGGPGKAAKPCKLQHVFCPACGHNNRQACLNCGHSLQTGSLPPAVNIGKVAGDVKIANRFVEIKRPQPNDAVGILKRTRSGDCAISTVSNLTLTQHHTTININPLVPVKVHIATDPEELQSATDGVMILRADWGDEPPEEPPPSSTQESRQPDTVAHHPSRQDKVKDKVKENVKVKEKEVIITRLINRHADDFFAEVLGLIQEDLPEKVVKELFHRFRLRLLGLTKRLEFLMEVDSANLPQALQLEPQIQEVLAELVPRDRRQEVTWASFSHLPVQCSSNNTAEAKSGTESALHTPEESSEDLISTEAEPVSLAEPVQCSEERNANTAFLPDDSVPWSHEQHPDLQHSLTEDSREAQLISQTEPVQEFDANTAYLPDDSVPYTHEQNPDLQHSLTEDSIEAESISHQLAQRPDQKDVFTTALPIEVPVSSTEEDLYLEHGEETGVSVETESVLDTVHSEDEALCTLQCSDPQDMQPDVDTAKSDDERLEAKPQRVFSIRPFSPKDNKKPYITSIACSKDNYNRLFMADKANKMVKVVDLRKPDDDVTVFLELPASPWGLAVLDDGLVAVTTKTSNIYLLETSGGELFVKSTIPTLRWYVGVASNTNTTLIVSCRESSAAADAERVDVINRRGDVMMTLVDGVRLPGLKSVGSLCCAGGEVLVSDFWGNAVYILDAASGQVVDTHSR